MSCNLMICKKSSFYLLKNLNNKKIKKKSSDSNLLLYESVQIQFIDCKTIKKNVTLFFVLLLCLENFSQFNPIN
jgi:hypothetical protein